MQLTARIPPRVVRAISRARFRSPALGRVLRMVGPHLAGGERVIAHGVGKGLRFDATGGYPGYALGTTEPLEQEALATYLRAGGVFYDLGANVGFFSTIAGRLVGPEGRVYAFEPFPESAARARANAARNGFENVTVIEAAASDRPGRMRLALSDSSATHRLAAGADGVEVAVVSLDQWQADTGAPLPDVVMIDVEGAELDVLTGMRRILAEARPVVLCEVHWLGQRFPDYFERELAPLGYRLEQLGTRPRLDGPPVRWNALLRPGQMAPAPEPSTSG